MWLDVRVVVMVTCSQQKSGVGTVVNNRTEKLLSVGLSSLHNRATPKPNVRGIIITTIHIKINRQSVKIHKKPLYISDLETNKNKPNNGKKTITKHTQGR